MRTTPGDVFGTVEYTVLLAALSYVLIEPFRRFVNHLMRNVTDELKAHHDAHHAEHLSEMAELRRHLLHIIDHSPEIPPLPPKETTP
jgi:hypothetical protein